MAIASFDGYDWKQFKEMIDSIHSDDQSCFEWWDENADCGFISVGNSPNEAVRNLILKNTKQRKMERLSGPCMP